MVTLLDIQRTYSSGEMRLELLADSKEDALPLNIADIPGLSGYGKITPGSTCMTAELDICIMQNNGQWGAWN